MVAVYDRFRHLYRPAVRLHIMNPDEGAAIHHSVYGGRKGSFFPLIGRKVKSQSDHGFAGGPKEDGIVKLLHPADLAYDRKVHLVGLPESDSGI